MSSRDPCSWRSLNEGLNLPLRNEALRALRAIDHKFLDGDLDRLIGRLGLNRSQRRKRPYAPVSGCPFLPPEETVTAVHVRSWAAARREDGVEQFSSAMPPARKSFLALFNRAPMDGYVWDYRAISTAHEARGGVWS